MMDAQLPDSSMDMDRVILAGLQETSLCNNVDHVQLSYQSAPGRKYDAKSLRISVSVNDVPTWSIKAVPEGGIFDPHRIVAAQRQLGKLGAFRVPEIKDQWTAAGWTFLVEEFIPDALELGTLFSEGVISAADARAVQEHILSSILGQTPLHQAREDTEHTALLTAIREAPLLSDQRDRLLAWTEANYLLISHPPVWTTRDVIPSNILRAPTGPENQDEWWLVDFDLACQTSLPWFDVLRTANRSPWGLAHWNQAWGDPSSLILQALTRVLEWDLQRAVVSDSSRYREHPLMLQITMDAWDRMLGLEHAETRIDQSPPLNKMEDGRNVAQLFWDLGSGYSEVNSAIITWPISEDLVTHRFMIPDGSTLRELRFDFANAPCAFELAAIILHTNKKSYEIPTESIIAQGHAKYLFKHPEFLVASVGIDPQLIIHISNTDEIVAGVSIIGRKLRGLDNHLAENFCNQFPQDTHILQELIKDRQISLRADQARYRTRIAQLQQCNLAQIKNLQAEVNNLHQQLLSCDSQREETVQSLESLRKQAAKEHQEGFTKLTELNQRLVDSEYQLSNEQQRNERERSVLLAQLAEKNQLLANIELRHAHEQQRTERERSALLTQLAKRDQLLADIELRHADERQRAETEHSAILTQLAKRDQLLADIELRYADERQQAERERNTLLSQFAERDRIIADITLHYTNERIRNEQERSALLTQLTQRDQLLSNIETHHTDERQSNERERSALIAQLTERDRLLTETEQRHLESNNRHRAESLQNYISIHQAYRQSLWWRIGYPLRRLFGLLTSHERELPKLHHDIK